MPIVSTSFIGYDIFPANLDEGVHNFDSHVFKVLFSNIAPNVATNQIRADASEIAAGNGYTAGGILIPITTVRTAGVDRVFPTNSSITAIGGNIANFRYSILYNSTAVNQPLIGYADYGSEIVITNNSIFEITFDSVNGLYDLRQVLA